ncbi:unnamed protein product [Cylicostephanus goldi]|uniref:Helicase C-terminal domain-containing protein n=1 Tax=Cylicostephanus goldi TaxID=71465 RepID=A0A3P6RPT5_CYLGO|nr:unnamed protein product [Cylicostephanus goldi]
MKSPQQIRKVYLNSAFHALKSVYISYRKCLSCLDTTLISSCESIRQVLEDAGFMAASISAQISQKDRCDIIERLKQNKLKVLVSTDLTARGIDASNVNLVVNLETAINAETYFHRIGRAARYGGYGAAVTLLADHREFSRFKAMVMKSGINVCLMSSAAPPDLTTNHSYFEQCSKFSSVQVSLRFSLLYEFKMDKRLTSSERLDFTSPPFPAQVWVNDQNERSRKVQAQARRSLGSEPQEHMVPVRLHLEAPKSNKWREVKEVWAL